MATKTEGTRLLNELQSDCNGVYIGKGSSAKKQADRCRVVSSALQNSPAHCPSPLTKREENLQLKLFVDKNNFATCRTVVNGLPDAAAATSSSGGSSTSSSGNTSSAEDFCANKIKSGSDKTHRRNVCEKAYNAAAAGKDQATACSGLRGNDKTDCATGYSGGAKVADDKNGGSVENTTLGCDSDVCDVNLPKSDNAPSQLTNLIRLAITVLGALAVLNIVLSGLRMVTAQGDSGQIAKARNGILYSVIGLLVAIVAQSIVYFALGRV